MEVIEACPDWRDRESVVATEIERKWVLKGFNPLVLSEGWVEFSIHQGYLFSDNDGEVRIRHSIGVGCTITVKGSGGLSRTEVESALSQEVFEALLPRCIGSFQKFRYEYGPVAGLTIDVFLGTLSNLVVAEVEFSSEKEANDFVFPTGIALVVIDVTDVKELKGKNLARHGLPEAFQHLLNV